MLSQVGIEATNACDGGCVMCARRHSKRPVRHMTVPEFRKVVDEILALGIDSRAQPTGISGIGETTLHPDLRGILEEAQRLHWGLSTNCQHLDGAMCDMLLEYRPTLVTLSLDGMTNTTMKEIRPGLDAIDMNYNATIFLHKLKELPVWDRDIYLQMVVSKLNAGEVNKWIEYWMPMIEGIPGVRLHVKEVMAWPGLPDTDKFYPCPPLNIPEHPQIQYSRYGGSLRKSCRLFWDFAWVASDGTYMPCCMAADDLWGAGNVFESSLEWCWKDDRMRQLRFLHEMHRWEDLPLCGQCP